MKKIIFLSLLAMIVFLPTQITSAQVSVGLQINIGSQPVWGPVGYDAARYYYFPDIEAYYCVQERVFCYFEGGHWVRRPALPPRYKAFDLYHSYKVVLNEKEPWRNHAVIRTKYASFKGRHDQPVIRDSRDPKYFVIKDHPEHNKVTPPARREAPQPKVREHEERRRVKERSEEREHRER